MDYRFFEDRSVTWYRTPYGGWVVELSVDGDFPVWTAAASEREARRAVRYVLGVDRLPPVRRDGPVRHIDVRVENDLGDGGLPDDFA